MNARIDDDVRIVTLVKGLAAVGLTLSNVPGGGLRIHRAETVANVIDLGARRRRDLETDSQIRAGMRELHRQPPDHDPGAA